MSNYAFFVGIDWADKKHDIAIVNDQGKLESITDIEHSSDAIDALISHLLAKAEGKPIAIVLEQSKGAVINALVLRENVDLFPINPKMFVSYRESFQNTKAKNDKLDAKLLGRFLFERHRSLKKWVPDEVQTRRLNGLCQLRRGLVEKRTSITQQLLNVVKCYFPALFCLADSKLYGCPLLLKLLTKWPDPRELKRQNPKTIRAVFEEFGYRNEAQRETLIKSIRGASLYTKDIVVLECAAIEAKLLAEQLSILEKSIVELEEKISQAMSIHSDAHLFTSLRGAGAALAPRLLTAFGTDRTKFADAGEFACYVGIAPVTKQSGQSCHVFRRHACNKYLLQTFHEFASATAKWCEWSKAYYNMWKAKGMKRHAILRKLAYKWIRILFRCWQTSTRFDPERYIMSLTLKNPEIVPFLERSKKSRKSA